MKKMSDKIAMLGLVLVLLAAVLGSCRSDKTTEGPQRMIVTEEDTASVSKLAVEFIETLKAKDLDSAIGMLYYLESPGDSVSGPVISPLSEEQAAEQRFVFERFPVLSYRIDNIVFNTETDCQVRYTFEFTEPEQEGGHGRHTSLFLQPMRIEGRWYLTVRDSSTPAGQASQIEN